MYNIAMLLCYPLPYPYLGVISMSILKLPHLRSIERLRGGGEGLRVVDLDVTIVAK